MIKLKDIIEQKKVLEELGLNEGPSTEEKRIASETMKTSQI